jgi:hypothetical protein
MRFCEATMKCAFAIHSAFARGVGALLASCVVLGFAAPAVAEPGVPGELQSKLQTACLPQCTLCHPTNAGGENKPYMISPIDGSPRGRGEFFANLYAVNGGPLVGVDAIVAAVVKLKDHPCSSSYAMPCDSDGDGITDYQELIQASDPDVANDPPRSTCDGPQYGCGASIGALPRGASDLERAAAAMVVAGLALVFVRRSGRR